MIALVITPNRDFGHCVRFRLGQNCVSLAFQQPRREARDGIDMVRMTPYINTNGEAIAAIRTFDDPTEIESFNDHAGDDLDLIVALRDKLTDLINRRHFDEDTMYSLDSIKADTRK